MSAAPDSTEPLFYNQAQKARDRLAEMRQPATTHVELVERAIYFFPSAEPTEIDAKIFPKAPTYEEARARIFGHVSKFKGQLDDFQRWQLACEISWLALNGEYRAHAERLLDTDLAQLLPQFQQYPPAKGFDSPYPPNWPERQDFSQMGMF